ncbi:hypothetical protein PR048_012779 [Dryococelus australis]|uniref:DUF4371 domain-containing protein n=1 Tax=Dryococelus australis TaxID=614101 RepID=A0ABQ9HQR0_9NEOP|nr:hypothetical protein PR048_012779 [Dryococelus australis]
MPFTCVYTEHNHNLSGRKEFFQDMSSYGCCKHIMVCASGARILHISTKYYGRQNLGNSTLRKNYLDFYYEDALSSVWHYIGKYHMCIAVDEITDVTGRYIANLVVECTNHATVTHFVNDCLKVLWPDGIQEKNVYCPLNQYYRGGVPSIKLLAFTVNIFKVNNMYLSHLHENQLVQCMSHKLHSMDQK